jgi:hypothetical protein
MKTSTLPRELSPAQQPVESLVYVDPLDQRAKGYCYCCGRVGFKVAEDRRISTHGFKRPGYGYITGSCFGSQHTPEETLALAIRFAEKRDSDLAALLATDLIKHATKHLVYRQREFKRRQSWAYRKDSHSRKYVADDIRKVRAGKSDLPARLRTSLVQDREQNARWLKELRSIKLPS